MAEVRVLTDSVAGIPAELARSSIIHVIPVRLTAEGRVHMDTEEDLPPPTVLRLQQCPTIDTTPWPPEFYCRAYEEAGVDGHTLVHVVAFSQFTSTISLARAGAEMAKHRVPELRVEVFDSESTGMAQGFIALSAARAAAGGASIDGVLAEAARTRSRVSSAFVLESLKYLARTGRALRLASWASSILHVTPVVGLTRGKEHPLGLARSRSQATRRLLEQVRSVPVSGSRLRVAVMASDDSEEARELVQRIEDELHPAELFLARVSPVTRVVAGPGLLGAAYYAESD